MSLLDKTQCLEERDFYPAPNFFKVWCWTILLALHLSFIERPIAPRGLAKPSNIFSPLFERANESRAQERRRLVFRCSLKPVDENATKRSDRKIIALGSVRR